MQQARRGPQFERPDGQRVVIGDYETPKRPGTGPDPRSARKPSLLERLKARFLGEEPRATRGPGFEQPDGAARVGAYKGRRRNRSSDQPRHRPIRYESND